MTQLYWIFFVVMAVMCLQATGDIAALEKKMEMFDQQLKICNTRLKSYDEILKNYDTRLRKLESEASLCSK